METEQAIAILGIVWAVFSLTGGAKEIDDYRKSGRCINSGSIWVRDVDTEKKEFKIVSLFDLREAGGEITD